MILNGKEITTIAELEVYLNGSFKLQDCSIDGVDCGGGYALPLLNFAFDTVGYRISTKDKTSFTFGDAGDFMGVCNGTPILTDDEAVFMSLLNMGVDCVYGDDINSLAETATHSEISFKIASEGKLRLGFKKHVINIPQGATKGRILSLINGTKELILTNANDIEAKPIQWLWHGWLPLGKLTVFAGAGGAGKTNILLNLIATISNGGAFPDGTQCTDKGEIIIYSTEDDIADTIKPRLMANGANLANIYFIEAKTDEKGETVPFSASEDLPLLYDYAQGKNIKLLMIDPIISAISKDMNKANDVRNGLQILVDFAQDFNCAVVGITHFAKGSKGADPADRIIGSQAFTALSRMSWVANRPNDPDKPCIFTRAKSNISELDGGFEYQIIPCEVDGIPTTKIEWGNFQNGTAKELLNDQDEQEEKEPTLLDEAKAFLVDLLRGNKEMKSSEVQQLAKEADITPKTLRNAREVVCDRPYKKSDGWYWRLKQDLKIAPSLSNLVSYGEPFPFT